MNCYKHSDKEATGYCTCCGKFICEDCILRVNKKIICVDCFKRQNGDNVTKAEIKKETVHAINEDDKLKVNAEKENTVDIAEDKVKISADNVADSIQKFAESATEATQKFAADTVKVTQNLTNNVAESEVYKENKQYLPIILSIVSLIPFLIGTIIRLIRTGIFIFDNGLIGTILGFMTFILSILSIAAMLIVTFMVYKNKKLSLPLPCIVLLPILVGLLGFISRMIYYMNFSRYYGLFSCIKMGLPIGTVLSILFIIAGSIYLGYTADRMK